MELETTRIFVKVAQLGSFSKAAHFLKMPVSTVSRAVKRLEQEAGTTLLQRTTRSLKLTASGKAFLESSAGPIQALEDARRFLQGSDSIVSGTVKLTAPEDLGGHVISPLLATLLRKHPTLCFDFNYTDELLDLIAGGYDLAVRIGKLAPSRFKALRIGEVSMIAVASPAYLASKPKIRDAKDFARHELLWFEGAVRLPLPPRAIGNQMTSLVAMATLGAGIALVPHFICQRQIASGELVRALPGWALERFTVSLVSVAPTRMSARVRLVADELAASLKLALRE